MTARGSSNCERTMRYIIEYCRDAGVLRPGPWAVMTDAAGDLCGGETPWGAFARLCEELGRIPTEVTHFHTLYTGQTNPGSGPKYTIFAHPLTAGIEYRIVPLPAALRPADPDELPERSRVIQLDRAESAEPTAPVAVAPDVLIPPPAHIKSLLMIYLKHNYFLEGRPVHWCIHWGVSGSTFVRSTDPGARPQEFRTRIDAEIHARRWFPSLPLVYDPSVKR